MSNEDIKPTWFQTTKEALDKDHPLNPFVLNSWLKSQRNMRVYTNTPNDVYYRRLTDALLPLLEDGHTEAWLAHEPDDKDNVFAYLLLRGGVIVYAYTKFNFRRQGLQKTLYEAAGSPTTTNYPFSRFPGVRIDIFSGVDQ